MTPFQEAVLSVVRLVPAGKVVSYGQVAAYVGTPRAARQVGWIMRSLEGAPDFPWWRVLNNSGTITIKGNLHNDALMQKKHLEAEGIHISESYQLDMNEYRFRPSPTALARLKLDPSYIEKLEKKYSVN